MLRVHGVFEFLLTDMLCSYMNMLVNYHKCCLGREFWRRSFALTELSTYPSASMNDLQPPCFLNCNKLPCQVLLNQCPVYMDLLGRFKYSARAEDILENEFIATT